MRDAARGSPDTRGDAPDAIASICEGERALQGFVPREMSGSAWIREADLSRPIESIFRLVRFRRV